MRRVATKVNSAVKRNVVAVVVQQLWVVAGCAMFRFGENELQ